MARGNRRGDPEKERATKARWYQANKEKSAAAARAWHAANKEKRQAYLAANRQRIRAQRLAYLAANPDKTQAYLAASKERRRARAAAYHVANRDTILARIRAWELAHPEEVKARAARRRARKRGSSENTLTAAQWQSIKVHYNFRCVYCHTKPRQLTMDHIVSLARGGTHTLSNIVPSCRRCNSKKGAGPVLSPVQPLLLAVPLKKERSTKRAIRLDRGAEPSLFDE